jgi:DNA-binding XRE family transcriptional regulator
LRPSLSEGLAVEQGGATDYSGEGGLSNEKGSAEREVGDDEHCSRGNFLTLPKQHAADAALADAIRDGQASSSGEPLSGQRRTCSVASIAPHVYTTSVAILKVLSGLSPGSREGEPVGRKHEQTEWEATMAERLKLLRRAAGMTQEALARKAGVSFAAYRGWERGTRTPLFDAAVKLADALEITLDELAGREPPRRKKRRK